MADVATVSARGARRWQLGHPWIYRSDVTEPPQCPPGSVPVQDHRGRAIGWALWSPASEISLRLLDRRTETRIDRAWWRDTLAKAIARRAPLRDVATAYRLVHGEADGCPSLICDRYDRWLVVQLMSAGLEHHRADIVDVLLDLTGADGILARHDVPLRSKERLPQGTELLHGDVPRSIEVMEHDVRYFAAPWDGQKTGAFLDQRENRARVATLSRGRALDCFSYHGSFALHLARGAVDVLALDASTTALERARVNAALNARENIRFVEANAFDHLRLLERADERFDIIVLDPPAFAKNRASIPGAMRGYKEINLRAMRLLTPGGVLFTASCSHHLTKPLFLEMLTSAAADSGRRIALRELTGQPLDHPEILSMPETGYLKGAILEAMN